MVKWLFDEGHGGTDPGATYNGRKEKDDVLKLAKRVKELMTANGEQVSVTRGSDKTLSLAARTNMENNGSYSYFVSFHRNAFQPEKAKGVETYSIATTGKGRELAQKVQAELKAYFTDRGCKTANFYVLKNTKCPAILIEIGFIDNSADNKIFDSNFENIAKAIAKGCLKQVGKNLGATTTPPTSSGTKYRVVCGWYSNKVNAEAQQKKLKAAGFDSFLAAYTSNGVAGYRVIAGTYSSKANAEAQQKKLKAKGFDSFLVAI